MAQAKSFKDVLNTIKVETIWTDDDLKDFVVQMKALAKAAGVDFDLCATVCHYFPKEDKTLIEKVISEGNYRLHMAGFLNNLTTVRNQVTSDFSFDIDKILNEHKDKLTKYPSITEFITLVNTNLTTYQQAQIFNSACQFYCEVKFNITPGEFANEMYAIAYVDGHSEGENGIYNCYAGLVKLYKIYDKLVNNGN